MSFQTQYPCITLSDCLKPIRADNRFKALELTKSSAKF